MPGETQVTGFNLSSGAGGHGGRRSIDYSRSPPRPRSEILHTVAQERYRGIRYRSELGRYISEIRPAQPRKRKIWLGTYKTAEEAARAFDAGIFYTKKPISYNFEDSPFTLEPLPENLSPEEEHVEIQKKAKAAAARAQPAERTLEPATPRRISAKMLSYDARNYDDEREDFYGRRTPTEIKFAVILNR